jgi:hypothetical protein
MSGRPDGVSVGSQRCVRSVRVLIGTHRGGLREDDLCVDPSELLLGFADYEGSQLTLAEFCNMSAVERDQKAGCNKSAGVVK